MTKGYNYDAITNTLTITKGFEKKAAVLGSEEYNIIKSIRGDYPNVTVQLTEPSKKAARKTITFKQIEAYIGIFDDEEKTLLGQFEKVKVLSKVQRSPYKYVMKWFENQFPNYQEQVNFDDQGKMEVAATTENVMEKVA